MTRLYWIKILITVMQLRPFIHFRTAIFLFSCTLILKWRIKSFFQTSIRYWPGNHTLELGHLQPFTLICTELNTGQNIAVWEVIISNITVDIQVYPVSLHWYWMSLLRSYVWGGIGFRVWKLHHFLNRMNLNLFLLSSSRSWEMLNYTMQTLRSIDLVGKKTAREFPDWDLLPG